MRAGLDRSAPERRGRTTDAPAGRYVAARLLARFGPAGGVLLVQLALFPIPLGVWVRGLTIGALTALVAVGMALIYRSHRILNFSQGDLGSVPAVLVVMLTTAWGWNYFAALGLGALAALLLGGVVELAVIRRFRKAPRLLLTVATIGVAQILAAGALLLPRLWGERLLAPRIDAPFDFSFTVGNVIFGANDLMAMIAAPAAMVALALFLQRTDAGVAIRASADDTERAGLLGVPVGRLQTLVWAIAGLLAFLAMFLRAGILGLPVGIALTLGVLLRSLAALTLGRLVDLPAVGAAALALGVLELGIAWNSSSPLLIDPILALVIVGGLLIRRRSRTRGGDEEASTWQLTEEPRPVSTELARLPVVRWTRAGAVAAIGGFALVLPHVLTVDRSLKASAVLVYAILGLSFVVLTGWAGQVSLGQVAFFAVGAATAAKLITAADIDPLLAVAASAAMAAAVAVAVGLPTVRLRGLYLAVTTFAFALATTSYLLNPRFFDWVPQARVEREPLLGRLAIDSATRMYYVVLVGLVLVLLALGGLRKSRAGRVLFALRENEAAAQAVGVSPTRVKMTAFAVSGALAGFAGGLFALHQQAFGRQPFEPEQNLALFAMVVIGGISSVPGAVLGALYVRSLGWFLPVDWQFMASGGGLLLVLMVLPSGLGGLAYQLRDRWLRRVARRHRVAAPGLTAEPFPDDPLGATPPVVVEAAAPSPATGCSC